ncbi:BTAD domain-containing putative transcriptional regulator [Planotetraspora kaengkrachanensis]|uniref:SARP family transcriptional regulator n=1 Tax=Planotetraspora kaengkrachanensis TaxID=575193 RepID=A0A8J3VC17_9ACTN|nr:BTAD domain-containing putative transcriptional regulator [Planotetraspora kaengkrachanensis]GIG84462.1 SARP family transcriptional regulator [Planotetraspora kaengkrachanensis]
MWVSLLGAMEVTDDDGERIDVTGPRVRALLAVLAARPRQVVTADALVDALWGDDPPAMAANALQTLVKRLRAALGRPDAVLWRAGGYALDVDPAQVDLERFAVLRHAGESATHPARAADALDEALALWRGPAFGGLPGLPYLANAATSLEEQRLTAVESRAEAYLALGRDLDLSAEAAAHPLRERLCALAMRALARGGRQAEALALYDKTRQALADELGVDPGSDLRDAHLAVLRGEISAGRRRPGFRAPALRAPLTSFVGRGDEVVHLGGLLKRSRLVTIIGPGGAGKTRLAIETALRAPAEPYGGSEPGGPWMAELASVTDAVDVPHAVLNALGIMGERAVTGEWREEARDPVDHLVASLNGRAALLVLDNCEHVIEAAAALADRLLAECPGVRVLATSREPLGVPGETLAAISPLGLPPAGATAADAAGYPAVRLLADRAAAVRPGFTLDEDNADAVVTICRRLDGMPLAIELAAARLRALGPAQLAARLDDRFRLLTGGSRTALPRQRTLRAVVEWSWDLLTPGERALAGRLAVFAGGATLDDAESVCGDPAEVRETLPPLVDKSLVEVTEDGRYRMLETIRAYALERLTEAGESGEFHARHARHFLALAEEAEPRLRAAGQERWIARLTAEQDNLHAALRWAIDSRDVEISLRLCGELSWYWWMRGYEGEAAVWAGRVVELVGDRPPAGLLRHYAACRIVLAVVQLGHAMADRERIGALFHEMEALIAAAESEGPVHPMLLIMRVVIAAMSGQDERARMLLDEYTVSGDPWLANSALMIRGGSLGLSDDPMRDIEAAVAGFRTTGDRRGLSESLLSLATLRARRGDLPSELVDEIIAVTGEWMSPQDVISALTRLAHLRLGAGDLEGAMSDLSAARARLSDAMPPHTLLQLGIAEAEIARHGGDLDAALLAYERVVALLDGVTVPQQAAMARGGYGRALLARGDLTAARREHRAAVEVLGTQPDVPVLALLVAGCAMVALADGDPEQAAVLFGAADAVNDGWRADPDAVAAMESARAGARAAFGEAYERGRALSLDEIRRVTTGG